MAAIEVSRLSDARQLAVHSAVVGAGWFAVAFAALVGSQLSDGLRDWIGGLPSVVQGIGATVVFAAALPLAWPVYIAIGWYEAGLASRIGSGDDSARRPAIRLLNGQAFAFASASVSAAGVAWLYRNAVGAGYVSLAWLPLAIIAALHLRTARALTHQRIRAARWWSPGATSERQRALAISSSPWTRRSETGILQWMLISGSTRRRMNVALVYAVALLMLATAGPSLALPDLVLHTVLGSLLVVATLAHLWLNRDRAISWPASGRLERWPKTARGWLLKGQDALRELFFIATFVSGAILMAGGPGLDLHATAGFTVLSLALIHAVLHRRWFAARLERSRASPD